MNWKLKRTLFVIGALLLVIIPGTGAAIAQQSANPNCPTQNFIDVSAGSAGAGYAQAQVNVSCPDSTMIVQSNGMINYEFVAITPNGLSEQNFTWEVTLNPQIAAQTTAIPLLGAIGFTVNGIPIFGPNEAAPQGFGDPFLDQILDYCNGHTAQGGMYHYHARPDCLFTDMEGNTSLVIGYAFDGFPILAPYICLDDACSVVVEVQSSWQRTQNVTAAWDAHEYIAGSGDLDQCNGRALADGSYAYYATDTFPYFLGCYRGTATGAGLGGGAGPGGQNGAGGELPTGQQPGNTAGQTGQVGQQPQGTVPNDQQQTGQTGLPPQGPPPNGGQPGGQNGPQGQPPQGGPGGGRPPRGGGQPPQG